MIETQKGILKSPVAPVDLQMSQSPQFVKGYALIWLNLMSPQRAVFSVV